MEPGPYVRAIPKLFEHVRLKCGEEVELLHDVHGQLPPIDCIGMVKRLEPYRPFFLEDPFLPEDIGYLTVLRQQSSVPIAIGEKFVHPQEFLDLITNRRIDFIRIHVSQLGGLSRARKIATLCEWFTIRTAWHGPRDVSPVGHAANAHLDLAVPNFGIQERIMFSPAVQEVFPGCPTIKNGFMYVNEAPGLGIDVNEKLAAKYPHPEGPGNWNPNRRTDGTVVGN
jgi:mannonate dehydratase